MCGAVVQALRGSHPRPLEPVRKDLTVPVHLQKERDSEPILPLDEGTQVGGEPVWQHGHDLVHEIDRGSPLECLLIQRRTLLHEVRYVGDMDSYLPDAIVRGDDR